jgi:hypothetical protein
MFTLGGAGGRGEKSKNEGTRHRIMVLGICRPIRWLFTELENGGLSIDIEGSGVKETSTITT